MTTPSLLMAASTAIAAVGVLLDAAELLHPRSPADRYFDGPARPGGDGPLARLVAALPLRAVVAAQGAAAVATPALLAAGAVGGGAAAAAVLGGLLVVRHRLAYAVEGADHMQLVVWASAAVFGLSAPGLGQSAALAFLAAQGVLAYVTAGAKKLGVGMWRDGTAVGAILATEAYGTPALARWAGRRWVSAPLTWLTLAFELGGPLLLLAGPPGALAFSAIALSFHLGVAATMGIDRFVFAFGATHPALFWAATQVAYVL